MNRRTVARSVAAYVLAGPQTWRRRTRPGGPRRPGGCRIPGAVRRRSSDRLPHRGPKRSGRWSGRGSPRARRTPSAGWWGAWVRIHFSFSLTGLGEFVGLLVEVIRAEQILPAPAAGGHQLVELVNRPGGRWHILVGPADVLVVTLPERRRGARAVAALVHAPPTLGVGLGRSRCHDRCRDHRGGQVSSWFPVSGWGNGFRAGAPGAQHEVLPGASGASGELVPSYLSSEPLEGLRYFRLNRHRVRRLPSFRPLRGRAR